MMPSLTHKNDQYSFGFWSKEIDGVSYNQMQKFWSELSPKARQELLKIDKQTLFEQARKNMYCSRCNGLLLEGFLQIGMHGKSLHTEGSVGNSPCSKSGPSKYQNDCNSVSSNGCVDEMQDPSVHPWGGLTTTRDGSLTLLDCYLHAKSVKELQNIFDSAPARERERELLYPDACGGGGRGWISQGMTSYGRGNGTREMCALHTARLSCDTLVDFWSALSEETRKSLLRMKEEDFMERLRFDSKRFCRDCRRNVIREFKELKELKRMRREPRCTTWFCVADTDFEYEVSIDSVQADWQENFADNTGMYHHFEWAMGTNEGRCDILRFENVGMKGRVQVNGLDLRGLNSCYITLRAFKSDGRWSEVSVKAHALKGQDCVHCRLVVGDGFVSIKEGESIRRFFEHAEEAEEEEDEDMMENDENELDGECCRPQKHAKSPELAREFLLDAATVIFKEQVEKAFREGTARQNAHSIFVCLTLKLLEQRVHVGCKEIITLEKQKKLLEEEEKEKCEEEERKEKKRTKEREKKLRRKERLKEKERDKEKKNPESADKEDLPNCKESEIETKDAKLSSGTENHYCDRPDTEIIDLEDENRYFTNDHQKPIHQNARYWKEVQSDNPLRWSDKRRFSENTSYVSNSEARYCNDRQLRVKASKTSDPNSFKSHEKFQCCDNGISERFDYNPGEKSESNISETRSMGESKTLNSVPDASKLKTKVGVSPTQSKQVWEPMEPKKYPQIKSDSEECSKAETIENISISQNSDEKSESGETKKWHLKDPMSTPSSDNCSSCLSEGERNTESSSTSDSEDAERTENIMCGKNVSQDAERKKNIICGKQNDILGKSQPAETSVVNVQQQEVIFPQMLQFPVYQTTSPISYFHQAPPVTWPMPFPHAAPYLYTGPVGYSLQYGNPLNPLATPFFNSGSVPVFNQAQTLEPPLELNGLASSETHAVSEDSFSLFHFSGPVGLSTINKSKPVQSKDDIVGNSNNKAKDKTEVEEYNLFATNNSLRFSLF